MGGPYSGGIYLLEMGPRIKARPGGTGTGMGLGWVRALDTFWGGFFGFLAAGLRVGKGDNPGFFCMD